MCGICGILSLDQQPVCGDTLESMTQTLRHRGPDDLGTEVLNGVGLGHTRLSIVDLTQAGHQPMFSEDGTFAIVYNGEVYNFLELKNRLEGLGVKFRGRSDTEVILKAYQQWGVGLFSMLNGMFAIAIWDAKSRSLCLARDRFGIKPLYYAVRGKTLFFGSEIKAILASEEIDRQIDWVSLHEYLFHGFTLAPRTMFRGISKLMPGHYMLVSKDGVKQDRVYWSLADPKPVEEDLEIATDRVKTLFDKAIQRHLISDVPVGVFLSGGIDSGSITALASKHYGKKLSTFSVGFDFDRGASELPLAKFVAEQCGTEHHELHVAGKDIAETIETLAVCHDEPFADAANIPLYLLCEELKGSVKVVLQGDGGDEIFAGYPWKYSLVQHPSFWRMISSLILPISRLMPQNEKSRRLRRLMHIASESNAAQKLAMMLARDNTKDEPPTEVLSENALRQISGSNPFSRYLELADELSHLEPADCLLRSDCAVSLPNQFLEKVDKSTMAHGIEVRVPFLDSDLTNYALGLPWKWKYRNGEKKWIFRRAMRGTTPDRILDGRKRGFGVPRSDWLRGPLAEYMRSVLLDPGVSHWGILDERVISRYVNEHTSGRRDRGILLYRLLNFALWNKSLSVS